MYDLATFRQRVKECYRQSYPYDDSRRATQADLASAVGLSVGELNRRLNGSKAAPLNDANVRAIVRTLAEWGAITTQNAALDLLDLLCCPQFSASEWNSPPLDSLAPLRPASYSPAPPAHNEKTNLPLSLTSFVGREREQVEVVRLLDEGRLLTLTGPGGVGKTRLALTIAASVAARFADGVWLVELAGLTDPELVPRAIANVVQVTERADKPLLETLVEALKGRETLLLLDNCEHLLLAVAQIAHRLLSYCPRLRVLTTSREGLRINGEVRFSVPPLAMPGTQAKLRLGRLTRYPAIRLFVERAQAGQPDFQLSGGNAAAVCDICQRLDGLPLAIELAAARVEALTLAGIQAGLIDRFALLTEGDRIALPRQQTLYALIDWSYALLNAEEQEIFAALGVFVGGFGSDAAEAVASQPDEGRWFTSRLGQLVDKSLIVRGAAGDEGRYGMLESIREYALAKLAADGWLDQRMARHAEYYRQLAELAEPLLKGAAQTVWLARLEQEHDNIRAALTWALKNNAETAARLAAAMSRFWNVRGYLNEGRRWLAAALNNQVEISAVARAGLLDGAGRLAYSQGDYSASDHYYQQVLTLKRLLGNQQGIYSALNHLGNVAHRQGAYLEAQALFEQGLLIARELGDQRGIGFLLNNLGEVSKAQGRLEAARQFYEEGVALLRSAGDSYNFSTGLNNLARIIYMQGDVATSRALHEQSLALHHELGNQRGIAISLQHLGDIACEQGDYATARKLLKESLSIRQKLGNEGDIANTLLSLGILARGDDAGSGGCLCPGRG